MLFLVQKARELTRARSPAMHSVAAEDFSLIPQPQEPGHCGPTSLSSCLAVLGIDADPRQLARAAEKPFRVYREGVDEYEIRRAAKRYGVRTEFLARLERDQGASFARRLRVHLRRGLPAILLVDAFSHWVALVGYLEQKRQFVAMDPDNRKESFDRWSEPALLRRGWNERASTEEPNQFFAILTRRRDGRSPRWRISEAFLHLCSAGSAQTADEMASDLIEMARRARSERAGEAPGPFLEQVLRRSERLVVRSVLHWAAFNRRTVRPADLRALYHDYTVIAAAAGIRLSRGAEEAAIVAQMCTLLTTYAWTGML